MTGGAVDAVEFIFKTLVISAIGFVCFVFYEGFKLIFPSPVVIESKEILKPTIKLTTDGEKIDTIYVYKLPKK